MDIEERLKAAITNDRLASFILPIKSGKLFLLERKKEPYKGWYCLVGGKREEGETPEETARREFCEEMYSSKESPPDYRFPLHHLGCIFDEEFDYLNHVFLGITDDLPPFVLNDAEVRRKRNVDEIKLAQFNPITKITLDYVAQVSFHETLPKEYLTGDLFTQIPVFEVPKKYSRLK